MAASLAGDIIKRIFLNENDIIPIQISLKYVPMSPIDNKPALVQVMALHRTGDKPLPETMMTQFFFRFPRVFLGSFSHLWCVLQYILYFFLFHFYELMVNCKS